MKRKAKTKIFILILTVSIIMLYGCAGTKSSDSDINTSDGEAADYSQPEGSAEDASSPLVFETEDTEGNVISSEIFSQSKLTMVNVWATYCNPCLSEMPGLGELAGEYDSEEFQIVGIISDVQADSAQEMRSYAEDLIEQTGADYTHLFLSESLYYALLTEVSAVPTTFFVDDGGEILDTVVGAMEKSDWEEKVDELLDE